MKYGSVYSNENALQVTSVDGKSYSFTVDNDSGWAGFTSSTSAKIDANHAFNAKYDRVVPFSCVDDSGSTISSAKLYDDETQITDDDVNVPENSFYVLNTTDKTLEF